MGCRFGREEFHVISVCGEAGHPLATQERLINGRVALMRGFRRPMVMREADLQ